MLVTIRGERFNHIVKVNFYLSLFLLDDGGGMSWNK